jgi:hypothetical protein
VTVGAISNVVSAHFESSRNEAQVRYSAPEEPSRVARGSLPPSLGMGVGFCLLLSRQGLSIVAQCFNTGCGSTTLLAVPVGTTEERRRFSRPCRDLYCTCWRMPSVKTLGYCQISLREKMWVRTGLAPLATPRCPCRGKTGSNPCFDLALARQYSRSNSLGKSSEHVAFFSQTRSAISTYSATSSS